MIEVITPAGFERFFLELAEIFQHGPPDPTILEPLAASYGLFFDPTWVPGLMERHHLTSRSGRPQPLHRQERSPSQTPRLFTRGDVARAPAWRQDQRARRAPAGRKTTGAPSPLHTKAEEGLAARPSREAQHKRGHIPMTGRW